MPKILIILAIVLNLFLLSSCSNSEWERALEERDRMIQELQDEVLQLQQALQICQQNLQPTKVSHPLNIPIYDPENPLLGQWERIGDNYAGAQVQVQELVPGHYAANLLKSGGLASIGFKSGDVKWQNVLVTEEKHVWKGEDAWRRTNDALAGMIAETGTTPMVLRLHDDNTLIITFPERDGRQVWKRLQISE